MHMPQEEGNQEIYYIHEVVSILSILRNASQPLTAADISKKLRKESELKISPKITKNYLWSYFRNMVDFDSNDWTYSLISKSVKFNIPTMDESEQKKSNILIAAWDGLPENIKSHPEELSSIILEERARLGSLEVDLFIENVLHKIKSRYVT